MIRAAGAGYACSFPNGKSEFVYIKELLEQSWRIVATARTLSQFRAAVARLEKGNPPYVRIDDDFILYQDGSRNFD